MNSRLRNSPLSGILFSFIFVLVFIGGAALFIVNSPLVLGQKTENTSISIQLNYASNQNYDPDNNGIETQTGIIDFELILGSHISSLNQSNLCSRWDIYSIDTQTPASACYGAGHCCSFIGLPASGPSWNNSFILTLGTLGTTSHNLISAQLVHVKYNLEDPSSDVFYSDWSSLPASFLSNSLNAMDSSVMGLGSLILTIASPQPLISSGENVNLQFQTNTDANVSYRFLNSQHSFPGGTQFNASLQGLLPFGVVENKQYNLTFIAQNESKDYTFSVQDTQGPSITINLTNASTITTDELHLTLNISSDEHALISHNFNNQGQSANIDLGEGRHTLVSLSPIFGLNTLSINSIDLQGNGRKHYFEFTYSAKASCTDGAQNGDEQGIDCGGSCGACIEFQVSLDKTSFSQNEEIFATVIARQNSYVNFTVYKGGQQTFAHLFAPVFSQAPIAETRRIQNTAVPGTYGIQADLYYLQNKQTKTLSFEVTGPPPNQLQVSIGSNASIINEGNPITFTSAVAGANGPLSYAWDFNSDKAVDSNEANPSYMFNQNGTYIINLTVSDSTNVNSGLHTITVRKVYNVSVLVKDNATQNNLANVRVFLDGIRLDTPDSGSVLYTHHKDSVSLRVEKDGFRTYSDPVEISSNLQVQINLSRIDIISPQISLISPASDSIVNFENISLSFRAVDENDMTCSLYFERNESPFSSPREIRYNVPSSQDSAFTVLAETNVSYKWRVDCADKRGNHNASMISSFRYEPPSQQQEVQLTQPSLEQEPNSDIIADIDSVVGSLSSLGTKEQKVAQAMQLREYLDKSRLAVERANRDINSLIWRKLNDSEFQKEQQAILERIEDVRKSTPRSITVLDTIEFVKYADKEDVRLLIDSLLGKTNLKLSKKQTRALLDATVELQNDLTVTTHGHVVQVEYLSGEVGFLTIIEKELESKQKDARIYEIMPKEIAQTIDEVSILGEYSLIEKDPIIEIKGDSAKLVYYVFKKLHESDLEKTKTILVDPNFKSAKSSATGFSILDTIGLSVVKTTDMRLIIEIVIILLLAAVYLVYSFGGLEQIRHIIHGKQSKEIFSLIDMAQQHVLNNEYEKALEHFKQIQQKYTGLDSSKKDLFKVNIANLTYDLNLLFINKLVARATNSIQTNRKEAFALYQKIQSLYKIIPKKHKETVSRKCLELHRLLIAK